MVTIDYEFDECDILLDQVVCEETNFSTYISKICFFQRILTEFSMAPLAVAYFAPPFSLWIRLCAHTISPSSDRAAFCIGKSIDSKSHEP